MIPENHSLEEEHHVEIRFLVYRQFVFKGAPSVFDYLLLTDAIRKSFSFSACRAEILFCMRVGCLES